MYRRRRHLVIGALRQMGIEIEPPKGTIYVWAPVPEGHTSASFAEEVLEQSAWWSARGRPTSQRRGVLPHLPHGARRPARGGGRADRCERPQLG